MAVFISTAAVSTSPASPIAGIDQRRAQREDLDRLLAEQEARHVEIMDHHVAEQPARALRRSRPAAATGSREITLTISIAPASPARSRVSQRGEIRVEAAVEADHQRLAGSADDGEAAPDAVGVEIDRLFAEHRLARRHRRSIRSAWVSVGVQISTASIAASARMASVVGDLRAGRGRQRGGGLRRGVGHGDQRRIGARRDVEAVDPADASGPQQSKPHRSSVCPCW